MLDELFQQQKLSECYGRWMENWKFCVFFFSNTFRFTQPPFQFDTYVVQHFSTMSVLFYRWSYVCAAFAWLILSRSLAAMVGISNSHDLHEYSPNDEAESIILK